MEKLTLVAYACLLLALSGSAQAAPVTLTFSELPPMMPAHGVSVAGVTFSFTIGGMPSTDARYNCSLPGICPLPSVYIQPPSLEGNAMGVLTLDFAAPTTLLSFGVVRSTEFALTPGVSVALFDPGLSLIGNFSVNTVSGPPFFVSEGLFSYTGGGLVRRAVITFASSATASRFAIDNLTFDPSAEPIPEPGTVLLLSTGLAGVGAAVRRKRKAGQNEEV